MRRVTDAYGRPLENLRLAVTAECNYSCIFCHIEGEPLSGPVKPGSLSPLLEPEDYYVISRAAYYLGIGSFKVTGGEPLIRNDIVSVISELKRGNPSAEISMTTNGYLLGKYIGELVEAGLHRVNVSLHSLRREKYRFITGVDALNLIKNNINKVKEYGLPLKLNAVILRGVNDNEVLDLIDYAWSNNATLQLIELHPVGLGAKFFKKYYYPLILIERELVRRGAKLTRRKLHNRPIYTLPNGAKVEIVKPYGNPTFCLGCTRIRIGPFGDLSPCLNWRGKRPTLLPAIRRGTLEERILNAVKLILKVNSMRKPFFLPQIKHDGMKKLNYNNRVRSLRVEIPKKKQYQEILAELESLLLGRGTP